jgi:hypothetical protein
MSNKRLQISTDNVNWYTFPGSTAAKKVELNAITDTIFGQPFESLNPTIGQSDYSGDSYFKGVAGYNAQIKETGIPTIMTSEPCTLVSGKTYQITNPAHRLIVVEANLVILDAGVNHTANVAFIDYLGGYIIFAPSYVVTGPVTVSGSYYPTQTLAKARSWTLTQTQTEIDATDYDDAQATNGMRTFLPGLKSVKLALMSIYFASNAYITDLLSRSTVFVVGDLEGATLPNQEVWRGMFRKVDHNQQGNQGALEEETINYDLFVYNNPLMSFPFSWYLSATSMLATAVQQAIQAWQNQSTIYIRYLPSGATGAVPPDGWTSAAIVTEASLANDSTGQNVFTFKFRATGALTNV